MVNKKGMALLDKINSGQLGGNSQRPINLNLTVKVGNQEFTTYISRVADNVRVEADMRGMAGKRIDW